MANHLVRLLPPILPGSIAERFWSLVGERTGKAMADEYGIKYRHLYSIVTGAAWKE